MTSLEAIGASLLAQLGQELTRQVINDPAPVLDLLEQIFCPHHNGYDACQDILDAVEAGHISHMAAIKAIAILMADMEQRGQRSAAPQPQRRAQPRAIATAPAVEMDFLSAIAQFVG